MIRKSRIVCAALRKNDVIVVGPRHYDHITVRQIINTQISFVDAEQGFVDQSGTFYNRVDALKIAEEAGQHIDYKRNGSKTELYSEGLY